jgi:hypothetical protein
MMRLLVIKNYYRILEKITQFNELLINLFEEITHKKQVFKE